MFLYFFLGHNKFSFSETGEVHLLRLVTPLAYVRLPDAGAFWGFPACGSGHFSFSSFSLPGLRCFWSQISPDLCSSDCVWGLCRSLSSWQCFGTLSCMLCLLCFLWSLSSASSGQGPQISAWISLLFWKLCQDSRLDSLICFCLTGIAVLHCLVFSIFLVSGWRVNPLSSSILEVEVPLQLQLHFL